MGNVPYGFGDDQALEDDHLSESSGVTGWISGLCDRVVGWAYDQFYQSGTGLVEASQVTSQITKKVSFEKVSFLIGSTESEQYDSDQDNDFLRPWDLESDSQNTPIFVLPGYEQSQNSGPVDADNDCANASEFTNRFSRIFSWYD